MKQRYGAGHLVLSAGRLIDWKGTEFLIRAMPAVLEKFPDTKLLIVGTGPERDTLIRLARELDLNDRVALPGTVPPADLPSYYRSADAFVLPSINRGGKTEGLGVVLLEAMASGCPVIGTNVGGIPDIITDGENGFLVPEQRPDLIAEKIVRIFTDTELQEKFRRNGMKRIHDSFSWDIISKDFSIVYDQVFVHQKKIIYP
jgi:glycosyltransferase involved in cell wall biosynthesis